MRIGLLCPGLVLALAACQPGNPRPDSVELDRDLLTVRFSNAETCLGPAPAEGAETGWSGTLQSCAYPHAYTVDIDPRANPIRLILQEVFGALGGEDILTPIATVSITDPSGRVRQFETPERFEED